MPIKINYSKKIADKSSSNQILFTNDKFNIQNLKKFLSNSEFSYVINLLKANDQKKKINYF